MKTRKLRAFRVETTDWPEATGIVRTYSPERAKFLTWKSSQEAGYSLGFGRFRVRREPTYDDVASLIAGRCYALEHAENLFS